MKRRDFIRLTGMAGAGIVLLPGFMRKGFAVTAATGLSDPALQPKFVNLVPDALHPNFLYYPLFGRYFVGAGPTVQMTGLVDTTRGGAGAPVATPVFGYGNRLRGYTWPGRTFIVKSGKPVSVYWFNDLVDPNTNQPVDHPVPVDTSLHWAYSLAGYNQYNIPMDGVPIVTHLHGGHSKDIFDGNPEYFFSPDYQIRGPRWVQTRYKYDNDQPAGNLWYHDHALGITRLNVYAGMAGFYFVRDNFDSGFKRNPAGLPAWPYEKAYAIQDRMFKATGELFYPAFPGDPYYADFIEGEGVVLPEDAFPGGGPAALAEFFGDHMVVNGLIWPKEEVEPRQYRLHLLNGMDSRFMAIRFRLAASPTATDLTGAGAPLPFFVVGSDQSLATGATETTMLLSEPGSRYDVVFDFKQVPFGSRIIMENIGGDEPFGGDIPGAQIYGETDRIMAFDVVKNRSNRRDTSISGSTSFSGGFVPNVNPVTRTRKVALFEGKDEFGRLQPLLGTAEPATDHAGAPIYWPATNTFFNAGLVGQMEGAIPWHTPTTENPALNSTEIWEVWNATGDAHPVHLHLVHFDVLERREIIWDSNTTEDERTIPNSSFSSPRGDGTYLVNQAVVQHNGEVGNGFKFASLKYSDAVLPQPDGYVENAAKDMVTALPDQVTFLKMTFDKPGRYVWHCHILSHEDHEMMRVLHVGEGAGNIAALGKDSQLAQGTVAGGFALGQNYPNPFNPSTSITFEVPEKARVQLRIYDVSGREVRALSRGNSYEKGSYTLVWDGTDKNGRHVATGTYIYRIKAGAFTQSKKMQLVR